MQQHPITLINSEDLRAWRQRFHESRIGFVPTMGALHEGHGSLIERIHEKCELVIVSIFVNPLQFGPQEDFERYPRTFKADLDLLAHYKVNAVYVPNVAAMYGQYFQTQVVNNRMSKSLCGISRPGHFDGVLTVVLKLLNLVKPHVVAFGKKDYQQWRLIAQMAKDLDLDVEVMGCETKRESDGLAMSSRNRYLTSEERAYAVKISEGLFAARNKFLKGEKSKSQLVGIAKEIVSQAPIVLEYLEICDQEMLVPMADKLDTPAVMLIAGKIGQTRLIDNIEL